MTDTRMTEHEVFQTHKVLEDKTLHKVHYDGPRGVPEVAAAQLRVFP